MQSISINQIIKKFQDKKFDPVYLLLGKEKFFHDQVTKALTDTAFSDPISKSLNLTIFYGSENTLSEITATALSFPMFTDNKVVIVREFSKIKTSDSEAFYKYLEKPQKNTILLISAEGPTPAALINTLKKNAISVDCKPIPDYKIPAWIKERTDIKELNINPEAIQLLSDYVGNNLLQIETELEKIVTFARKDEEISLNNIANLIGISAEYNVFTLQRELINKNIKKSYRIGFRLLELGENINFITAVIFSHFRKALIFGSMKDRPQMNELKTELKLNDFQIKDLNNTLSKFSIDKLNYIIEFLSEMDKKIKISSMSEKSAMFNLCYFICNS